MNISTITRSQDLEPLATLLTGLLFGWEMGDMEYYGLIEDAPEDEGEVEEFEELPGLTLMISEDWEQEHSVHEWDDETGRSYLVCHDVNVGLDSPWWTTSGDNPVTMSQADQADQKDRNLYETQSPNWQYYSAVSPLTTEYRKRERRFQQFLTALMEKGVDPRGLGYEDMYNTKCVSWVRWIQEAQKKGTHVLRKGWRIFWKQYFSHTAPGITFLPKKYVDMIRAEFKKYGVEAKKNNK